MVAGIVATGTLPVTAAYIVLSILSAPALAGMLADVEIIQSLTRGISDPSVLAMLMLVDSPLVANISNGLSLAEAQEFMRTIPFEIALVIRPALLSEEAMLAYLLSAHLIVFWLSQDSNVTPPVCLAAFTAAGIAGSKPMRTGVEAWRISKGLYIVPLLIAYTPLVSGDWLAVLQVGFFSLFGIYAFNTLIAWHHEGPMKIWQVPLIAAAAAGCFLPLNLLFNVIGAVVVVTLVVVVSRARAATGH